MTDSVENRRIGREKELKDKLKSAAERYEGIFGKPLSVKVLTEFLDHSERQNWITFLKSRIGEPLSDVDIKYLRDIVRSTMGSDSPSEGRVALAQHVDDDLDDLDIDPTDLNAP